MAVPAPAQPPLPQDGRYEVKEGLEIHPLDAASLRHDYVVRTSDERSFVISENLRRVLMMFQGGRTCSQVADSLSRTQRTPVPVERVREIAQDFLHKNGLLVQEGEEESEQGDVKKKGKKRSPFDFAFRLPLLSPAVMEPIASRLTWLFERGVVYVGLVLIGLVHLSLLFEWIAPRPAFQFTAGGVAMLYALALGTVLFHEFGHVAACRRYGCPHGPIGFTVYLIFPALYADLSQAWRLSGRQRAVIDIGGIYFQLLTVIPLYGLLLLTGHPIFAATIYTVDSMVLFALNPIFKFDGYWLMVDLSGIFNLQKRVMKVMGEIIRFVLGFADDVPSLKDIRGRGRRIFLAIYSSATILIFGVFIALLVVIAPNRVNAVFEAVGNLAADLNQGPGALVAGALDILIRILFVFILARLLYRLAVPLIKRLKARLLKGESTS